MGERRPIGDARKGEREKRDWIGARGRDSTEWINEDGSNSEAEVRERVDEGWWKRESLEVEERG